MFHEPLRLDERTGIRECWRVYPHRDFLSQWLQHVLPSSGICVYNSDHFPMTATVLRFPLFLVFTAVLLAGLLGACGGDGTQKDAKVANPRLVQTPDGQRVFAGTLVNQGASTIGIAEVEVALYDDQGSRIETMRIQVQDVTPGDSVEFNQTVDSDQPIQQAQVREILIP